MGEGALLGGTVWGELGCVLGGAGGSGMRGVVGREPCALRVVQGELCGGNCGGRALCVESCVWGAVWGEVSIVFLVTSNLI